MAERLALQHIDKRFGSVHALRDVEFVLHSGQVHALLGENGAGKTTLMRIAYGMTRADRGTVRFNGAPATIGTPRDARAIGIGMVHQSPARSTDSTSGLKEQACPSPPCPPSRYHCSVISRYWGRWPFPSRF